MTDNPSPVTTGRLPSTASALPYSGHRFSEFFVGDVQVSLRLLDVGVTQHQLDGTDVNAIAQEPAGAFVTQIVPVQVDLPELLSIDSTSSLRE